MSIKYITLLFTISLLSIGCFEEKTTENHSLRLHQSQFGYKGAVDRSIGLKFFVRKNTVSEISARVQIPSDYPGTLTYKWMLGEGVKITEGTQTGQVNSENQKEISISIKVAGFTTPPQKFVRFEIISDNPQRRLFVDGLVSSDQENSFEQIVKEVEEYKKETTQENKKELKKEIVHEK